MNFMIAMPVIFPVVMALILLLGRMEDVRSIKKYAISCVVINAALAWTAILFAGEGSITLATFTEEMHLTLKLDGMSRIFAGMVSVLWIFTTVYAFEYMKHEGMEKKFFSFFIMSFGVVMGIAFAQNLFTLYMFYEYLTFATLPLVMHQMSRKSRHAGRVYLAFSITGGAAVFVAMMFLMRWGVSLDFARGGMGGVPAGAE